MAAAAETAGEVAEHVEGGFGVSDVHPAEHPREPGASAPAFALRNLLVAERRRIAATQMRMLKAQVSFASAAADRAVGGASDRARLMAASIDLHELEEKSHASPRRAAASSPASCCRTTAAGSISTTSTSPATSRGSRPSWRPARR